MVRAKKTPKNDPSHKTLKADYYPVQRTVNLGTTASTTKFVLDTARVMSSVNHRLYRQGKTYQVKIDFDNRSDTTAGPAQFEVWALVDTWYVQKAWQLARATYLEATASERAVMSGQKLARWEDFRVKAGISGGTLIVPYRYSPALVGANDTAGEFENSRITLADGTTQRDFTWGNSPSASEFSILQEYDKSGNTDLSPSTVSATNPYAGSDGDVHEIQMDDLAAHGNSPPYDAANFSDNVWVRIAVLDNSGAANPGLSADSRMTTGFFNAPCGLVVIKPDISSQLTGQLRMTVKAGDYKGVAAMNMGA